jgi:uncharacterized protein with HEPN domain
MAPRFFRIRLVDIREEIAGIRDLTKNATAKSFATSWAMKRAVEHALLIIAEAAKHRGRGFTASATYCATNIAGLIPISYGRL